MQMIIRPGMRAGSIQIPSSKSVVHRLLICAGLGRSPVRLQLSGLSKDILATAECLSAMGCRIDLNETDISVYPGSTPGDPVLLPCGESGSTLRFLLPVAGALGLSGTFRMEGRLSLRPMKVYEDLLSAHGMHISRENDLLHFSGRLIPGDYSLPGNISSQYFSGLLMALPLLPGASSVAAEGSLESGGYILLTENSLSGAGISFTKPDGSHWQIPGGQQYLLPSLVKAEGDWSNAAFFLCMGALSDAGMTVSGLDLQSGQGDSSILELLGRFGAVAELSPHTGTVFVKRGTCNPLVIDASPIPDLIPVLSVLSCAAEGDTRVVNASRLRMKESDRLHTTALLISSLGGKVEELEDSLIIHGTGRLRGGCADSCNDHRIAMSAAVAACICSEPVEVNGAESVEKSYPGFWDDFGGCVL